MQSYERQETTEMSDIDFVVLGALDRETRQILESKPYVFREFLEIDSLIDFLRNTQPDTARLAVIGRVSGAIQQDQLDQVMNEWPLLNVVIAGGEWCEGEERSGWPLEGAPRIRLDEWRRCMERPNWKEAWPSTIPVRTRQPFEKWLDSSWSGALDCQPIGIASDWLESGRAIQELLHEAGYQDVTLVDGDSLADGDATERKLIVDCQRGLDQRQRSILERLTPEQAATTVIVAGFLRPQDRTYLRSLGVHSFLSKPFDVRFLLEAIAPGYPSDDPA